MPTSKVKLSSESKPNIRIYFRSLTLSGSGDTHGLSPFGPSRTAAFINLDDTTYVYENAYVQSGLNWNSIEQAFSFSSELAEKSSNWHR